MLLITDGAGSEVIVGDYAFIGDMRITNGRMQWSCVELGHVDLNSTLDSSNRPYRIWQWTVRGWLTAGVDDIGSRMREHFNLSEEAYAELEFDVVAVHAGADFLAHTLYNSPGNGPQLGVTPEVLLRQIENLIVQHTRPLPCRNRVVLLGLGFPGGHPPAPSDRQTAAHVIITGRTDLRRLNMLNRDDWIYYDKVLQYMNEYLAEDRRTTGRFPPGNRERLRCFLIGSLANVGVSNGHGYPFSADLANAGRLLWGGVCGAARRLGYDRGGLGYFDFRNREELGSVARWSENREYVDTQPGVLRPFGDINQIPAHLYECEGARPVSRREKEKK